MRTILVRVTQEHIDAGNKPLDWGKHARSRHCPVSLAVSEAVGRPCTWAWRTGFPNDAPDIQLSASQFVADQVHALDVALHSLGGPSVGPFEFELEVPDGALADPPAVP